MILLMSLNYIPSILFDHTCNLLNNYEMTTGFHMNSQCA